MRLPPQSPAVVPQISHEPLTEQIEILDAFADLPDVRNAFGKRYPITLCLALFTLAVTAGNRGFWRFAIGGNRQSRRPASPSDSVGERPRLKPLVRVESERQFKHDGKLRRETETATISPHFWHRRTPLLSVFEAIGALNTRFIPSAL